MKKFLGLTLSVMFMLTIFATCSYATTYDYDSFFAQGGYGTKARVDDNVTNLKGSAENEGMCKGPMSTKSTAKLTDEGGITEEVYIDLDLDKFDYGELFEVTLALKADDEDGTDKYANEQVVRTQKTAENEFTIQANGTSLNLPVKESGIYIYRWNMHTEEGKTYSKFTLYKANGDFVGTTGYVNLDDQGTEDASDNLAEEKNVGVYHLWFCNIKAKEGVNVLASLPKTSEPEPEPEPVPEPVPTPAPSTTPADKDETPGTGSVDVALIASVVAIMSVAGIVAVKKYNK